MKGKKPIDVGDGRSCGSFLPNGDWLAITRPAPVHGMVELTGAAPFDEDWRGDPAAVRRYRASLTGATTAFLIPSLADSAMTVEDWGVDENGAIWIRSVAQPGQASIRVDFNGRLQRPPYAEITEIAPLAALPVDSRIHVDEGVLTVTSETLKAHAEIAIEVAIGTEVVDHDGRWLIESSDRAVWKLNLDGPPSALPLSLTVRCRLGLDREPRVVSRHHREDRWGRARLAWLSGSIHPDLFENLVHLVEGSRAYILDCCSLAISDRESVIVTDHRLLPLSWTRDAYYMALLLLLCRDDDAVSAVERHLHWLWGPAHRSGVWMRSHLATGEVKDPGLQADQQLYPILELLDYRRVTGVWPEMTPAGHAGDPLAESVEWGQRIEGALADLPVDDRSGLLMSEENPADDASGYPLLFSSQVLFAHVLDGLATYSDELRLNGIALSIRAEQVRRKSRATFTVTVGSEELFAYEADGHGATRLYGDANDLPTVLAPAWGFCDPSDPVWAATMRFVLSAKNPGWSEGRFGGLGSAHTAGTWALGDVQSLLFAQAQERGEDAARSLARISWIASSDGMLPEAYDSQSGEWTARHWFGWPAAAAAAALLSPLMSVEST